MVTGAKRAEVTTHNLPPDARFRHKAFPYAGADHFVARAAPIVAGAVEAGNPVLVAIDAAKIERLRDCLGSASGSVAWKDIRGIGGNPARIIPLWREFVARHRPRRRLWGIGEPVWPERGPAELIEAQRHEQLLNLAFAGVPNFTLLCPYDTERLDPDTVREGHRCHPLIAAEDGAWPSADYPGLTEITAPLDPSLPEPAGEPFEFAVDGAGNALVRSHLQELAHQAGVDVVRADDLTFAIAAVTHHMGRPGTRRVARVWREAGSLLAELPDLAAPGDPLAGREWPAPAAGPGRGLWLANQLCDLVQLRSSDADAVVRLHVRR
jgi:MEDS: MEthanogen/methylotroph, DcmR Sensory domain